MRFIRKYVRMKQNCYQAKMLKLVESTLVAVPPHRVELCASASSTSVGSRPLGYSKAEVWSGSRLAVNVASLFHNPEYLTPSTRVCLACVSALWAFAKGLVEVLGDFEQIIITTLREVCKAGLIFT